MSQANGNVKAALKYLDGHFEDFKRTLVELSRIPSISADPDSARTFGITRTPATVVIGAQDYGVRYFGIPGGYEFSTLLDIIIAVSRATPPIAEETREILSRLKNDAHIQVFVTPT